MLLNERKKVFGSGVVLLSLVFIFFSFPPFKLPFLAFICFIPFLVFSCALEKTKKALVLISALIAYSTWFALLIWLRHVTWLGTLLLVACVGSFLFVWLYVAGRMFPKLVRAPAFGSLLGLLALASFWVLGEWVRTFLFTGFPWLPFAATQWAQPAMLALAPWTGFYGISFVLVFFNLALASTLFKSFSPNSPSYIKGLRKRQKPIEFYLAICMLLGTIWLFVSFLPKKEKEKILFKAGVVQPYVLPALKWAPEMYQNNFQILLEKSIELKDAKPDVIIWPETALPVIFNIREDVQRWIYSLVKDLNALFFVGAIAKENENWYNAIFQICPYKGVLKEYYAKEAIVPFGKYIPFRKALPFLNKAVPVDFDLTAQRESSVLPVKLPNGLRLKYGGLICYEDIFPQIARKRVLAGADFLIMLANDAWYGHEGAAYQHAAASVLRAAETRRPIIRCGNNGLSGWINEWGIFKHVSVDKKNSVYYRGKDSFEVYRDQRCAQIKTFYVKYGDWFVALCAALTFLGLIVNKKKK